MKQKRLGGLLPKLIMAAIAIYAVISIISLNTKIETAREVNGTLQEQVDQQKLENAEYEDDIARKDDPEKIAELARDNFGLVESGETVFYDIGG